MKKLKAHWSSLSRAQRCLLLLSQLCFLVLLLYFHISSSLISPEEGFRRMEKSNMIGPSQILAEFALDGEYKKTENIIIAQSSDLDILYNHRQHTLHAYPKTELPALYSASVRSPFPMRVNLTEFPLQLILFDRNTKAESAEISFCFDINPYFMFKATAIREHDGFFYFTIMRNNGRDSTWLRTMHQLCYNYGSEGKVEVNVKLYDKNGQLLSDDTILPGPSIE